MPDDPVEFVNTTTQDQAVALSRAMFERERLGMNVMRKLGPCSECRAEADQYCSCTRPDMTCRTARTKDTVEPPGTVLLWMSDEVRAAPEIAPLSTTPFEVKRSLPRWRIEGMLIGLAEGTVDALFQFCVEPPRKWTNARARRLYVYLWPIAMPIRCVAVVIASTVFGIFALTYLFFRDFLFDHFRTIIKGVPARTAPAKTENDKEYEHGH